MLVEVMLEPLGKPGAVLPLVLASFTVEPGEGMAVPLDLGREVAPDDMGVPLRGPASKTGWEGSRSPRKEGQSSGALSGSRQRSSPRAVGGLARGAAEALGQFTSSATGKRQHREENGDGKEGKKGRDEGEGRSREGVEPSM